MSAALVEIDNVSKSFGNVRALEGVSLTVAPGVVHAITGENGAGKSTLMKMLAGVVQPSAGEIRVSGRVVDFSTPLDALRAGISIVFQEFTLIPNLTVAENIFLGREPKTARGAIDEQALRAGTMQALSRLGLEIDPGTIVWNLTVAEQQVVEIAKGISADAQVFIFDEPTAALNTADVAKLHRLIRDLRREGKAVLYISHRLEEIFALCDTVTVLKDGRHVATRPTEGLDEHGLVALMVGRELSDFFPPRSAGGAGVLLSVQGLRPAGSVASVSFDLKRGEILGLAGLEGQGQRAIARALAGIETRVSGELFKTDRVGNRFALPPDATPGGMLAHGIGFVPEDRKTEGLFLDLSIRENIAVGRESGRGFWSIAPNVREAVAGMMKSMNIRASGTQAAVGTLSGGNQQKVLLGRWLSADVDILIVEEPTRGVDVGAKAEIYKLLRAFADKGGGVLALSRETPELIGVCDRLLVVHGGDIVAEMKADGATEHDILHSAIGSRQAAE